MNTFTCHLHIGFKSTQQTMNVQISLDVVEHHMQYAHLIGLAWLSNESVTIDHVSWFSSKNIGTESRYNCERYILEHNTKLIPYEGHSISLAILIEGDGFAMTSRPNLQLNLTVG